MAYGTYSPNDYVLYSSAVSDSSTQLDNIIFSDFIQGVAPSASIPASGGTIFATTANGGAITNNTTSHIEAFGVTACAGVISLSTGTTNNATGIASCYTSPTLIPGLATPASGRVSRYECETFIRTDSGGVHSNSVRGAYRFGFMSTIGTAAIEDGVYFEFLCDGTTTDSNWFIVFRKDNVQSRVDTTLAVSASKSYRLYLSVDISSGGTITTRYNVRNVTDGTSASGTASPSSNSHYPTAAGDWLGVTLQNTKAVTATTTARLIYVDYIGARIRKDLTRTIELYT